MMQCYSFSRNQDLMDLEIADHECTPVRPQFAINF